MKGLVELLDMTISCESEMNPSSIGGIRVYLKEKNKPSNIT
jgi:hypothetical protein